MDVFLLSIVCYFVDMSFLSIFSYGQYFRFVDICYFVLFDSFLMSIFSHDRYFFLSITYYWRVSYRRYFRIVDNFILSIVTMLLPAHFFYCFLVVDSFVLSTIDYCQHFRVGR